MLAKGLILNAYNINCCYIHLNKVNMTTEGQLFHSYNHLKWLPYKNINGKTIKNVQFDPQTTEI